ncbi:unnamed protein product [Lampetra planeri]
MQLPRSYLGRVSPQVVLVTRGRTGIRRRVSKSRLPSRPHDAVGLHSSAWILRGFGAEVLVTVAIVGCNLGPPELTQSPRPPRHAKSHGLEIIRPLSPAGTSRPGREGAVSLAAALDVGQQSGAAAPVVVAATTTGAAATALHELHPHPP